MWFVRSKRQNSFLLEVGYEYKENYKAECEDKYKSADIDRVPYYCVKGYNN